MSEDRDNSPCDPDPDELAAESAWALLRSELLAPGLRWLVSGLAVVSCGVLSWWAAGGRPEVHFPIHVRGSAAWLVAVTAAVLWVGSAVGLWAWWLRGERDRAEPNSAADRRGT